MAILVKRRCATGLSLLRRILAGSLSPYRDFADRKLAAQMMMSTAVNSSPSSSRSMSPWLMLPPVFEEGGDMVYKFYNLSEEKEESFKSEEEIADDDTKFVGSSHGWLALLNHHNNNNHLFLYNPITRRHINLPPIETLPDPRMNLTPDGRATVSKLILSSSPDHDDDKCIAMMTFGRGDRLAFCHPCRSTEWTPIGDLFFSDFSNGNSGDYENPFMYNGMNYGRAYEDFVYCGRSKRFTCVTQFEIDLLDFRLCSPTCELEDWDLRNPQSPISTTCNGGMQSLGLAGGEWIDQNFSLVDECRQIPYLVFSEQHNQLFVVIRFVMGQVAPDGSLVHVEDIPYDPISGQLLIDTYPYKTVGFCVLKVDYDRKDGDYHRVVEEVSLVKGGSLDGLTMFVGMNHSFAVSAAEFPNLKPNSIYFTDANKHGNSIWGGHDIGIFDYEKKALSSCFCYPCVDDASSLTRIEPPPMWFTPSLC